ncbi:hypothetical protein OC845_000660 [Tilletia horrida]|nr:hypothetical protein OC845_000660 [Tilletia horrida]
MFAVLAFILQAVAVFAQPTDQELGLHRRLNGLDGHTFFIGLNRDEPALPRLTLPLKGYHERSSFNALVSGTEPECVVSTAAFNVSASQYAYSKGMKYVDRLNPAIHGEVYYSDLTLQDASCPALVASINSTKEFASCGITWARDPGYDDHVYSMFYNWDRAISPVQIGFHYDFARPEFRVGSDCGVIRDEQWIDAKVPQKESYGFWSPEGAIGRGYHGRLVIDPKHSDIVTSVPDAEEIIKSLGLSPIRDAAGRTTATYPCNKPPKVVVTVGKVEVSLTETVLTYRKVGVGRCQLPIHGNHGHTLAPTLGSAFLASIDQVIFQLDTAQLAILPLSAKQPK